MSLTLHPKPVQFKFGEYISQAFELMKKDFGTIFLSFLCVLILSLIPFLSLMATGNFYKICYKIDKGIPTGPGEIFNFDDFVPYFIFQLYILAGLILLFVPFGIFTVSIDNDGALSGIVMFIGIAFLVIVYFAIIFMLLQAFYVPALITFKKITDIKAAWDISKRMTKGNLLMIFLFSIVITFLGEIGILLCGIGIFLTIPFINVAHYFAFKDGLSQIELE